MIKLLLSEHQQLLLNFSPTNLKEQNSLSETLSGQFNTIPLLREDPSTDFTQKVNSVMQKLSRTDFGTCQKDVMKIIGLTPITDQEMDMLNMNLSDSYSKIAFEESKSDECRSFKSPAKASRFKD